MSPVFIEVKRRMKSILKDWVIYVDGKSPLDLSALLVCYSDVTYFVEDDMEKQDR